MRNLYESNPVNAVRLGTDVHFADYENEYSYRDFMDGFFKFVEEFQLLRPDLWARFVQQFREEDADYASKPDIKWNFTKFLVNREGKVIERFEPTADMDVVAKAIKKLL